MDAQIPDPPLTEQVFLPLIQAAPTCIEGQQLIQYNPGFEFPPQNPAPWIEVTTYYDPPDTYYYHIVQDDWWNAHSGQNYAFFGDQVFFGREVDEELLQSIRIPAGAASIQWKQWLWLEQTGGNASSYGTEFGDKHIFALKDSVTGAGIVPDLVIDHTSTDFSNYVWLNFTYTISGSSLGGQQVGLSYSSITDGDTTASTIQVDDVQLIVHCNGSQNQPSSPSWNIEVVEE